MPQPQHKTMQYNLFGIRHELINQEMPTHQEELALQLLNDWYDGLSSEVSTVNKLIKIGILTNE